MKLLLKFTMIFFGTLMAAAVIALGEPAQADVAMTQPADGLVAASAASQSGPR